MENPKPNMISELFTEIDSRRFGGIETTLLWQRDTDSVWIHLTDEPANRDLLFEVPGAEAAKAFEHPYAYAHALGQIATNGKRGR